MRAARSSWPSSNDRRASAWRISGCAGIDAQRGVELGDGAGAIALGQRDLRQLEVHDGALLGAPRAVRREHGASVSAAFSRSPVARRAEARRRWTARVLGPELGGLLQQRDGGRRVAVPHQMDLRGLAQPRAATRRDPASCAASSAIELGERPPLAGLLVEGRQPLAQRGLRPGRSSCAARSSRAPRPPGLARSLQRRRRGGAPARRRIRLTPAGRPGRDRRGAPAPRRPRRDPRAP